MPKLAAHPDVQVHTATRIADAHVLAQRRLDRLGCTVAAKVTAHAPDARVMVNGVNCSWRDINWVILCTANGRSAARRPLVVQAQAWPRELVEFTQGAQRAPKGPHRDCEFRADAGRSDSRLSEWRPNACIRFIWAAVPNCNPSRRIGERSHAHGLVSRRIVRLSRLSARSAMTRARASIPCGRPGGLYANDRFGTPISWLRAAGARTGSTCRRRSHRHPRDRESGRRSYRALSDRAKRPLAES